MIIIADDDELLDEDLQRLLDLEGFHDIRCVKTCKELLAIMREGARPTVIVLDMMLPRDETDFRGGRPPDDPKELRGLSVLEDLKDMRYDLRRVLVITAFYSQPAKKLLRDVGILQDNILFKPFRTHDLLVQVWATCNLVEGPP